MSNARIAIGFLAGAVLGAGVVHSLAPAENTTEIELPEARAGPDEARPGGDAELTAPRDEPPSSADSADRDEAGERADAGGGENGDELIGPRLRDYALENISAGWKGVRPDRIPQPVLDEGYGQFEDLVMSSPRNIGRQLGERQTKREEAEEDTRTGGVFALLESLAAGGVGPMVDQVADRKSFEKFFDRSIGERTVSGLDHLTRVKDALEDGVTVDFPDGVFKIRDVLARGESPRDVTLAGRGKDRTLLVLDHSIYTGSRIRNLTIRDCTIFTDSRPLFDLRSRPASISLERLRLIGFDSGAGGSSAINTRGLALRMTDCIVAGGYGRSQHSGNLFDVRTDALLARFDHCRFERTRVLSGVRRGATLVFDGCDLIDVFDDVEARAGELAGVRLVNTAADPFTGDHDTLPELDLNDLFPDWKERME